MEPGEHLGDTARREAREELGIEAVFADPSGGPSFVTVTRTRGVDAGHTDVSMWFLLRGDRSMTLLLDRSELREARWWSRAELAAADPGRFDPHLGRFVAKQSTQ